MGRVVDPEGRVYGVNNLRVVDASIMPSMTSGNLNAPTIMMAEKLSDSILGHPPLRAPESLDWQLAGEWQTNQRGTYDDPSS